MALAQAPSPRIRRVTGAHAHPPSDPAAALPARSGPRVRQYYVLRHLAARHDVSLVCFGRPNDSAEAVAHLRTHCRDVRVVAMHRVARERRGQPDQEPLTRRPVNILRDERRR